MKMHNASSVKTRKDISEMLSFTNPPYSEDSCYTSRKLKEGHWDWGMETNIEKKNF